MGDGDKSSRKITRTVEMENLSLDVSKSTSSRDLLQRFMGTSSDFASNKDEEEEEIELNLGLSLGGRFGVDRNTDNLGRSSSIASCLPIARNDSIGGGGGPPGAPPPGPTGPSGPAYAVLSRTSSLPVETEEEWRKRKEMQSLRRMEAKRRRSEKQRNLRSERESLRREREGESLISAEERREIEANVRGRLDREKSMNVLRRQGSSVGGGLAAMMAAGKGKGSGYVGRQGSVESKGGSCSSDLESKALQGSSGDLSPASIQSLQEAINQDIGSSAMRPREHATRTESSLRRPTDVARNQGREIGMNALEDMPCVFTKGDGPNGRRIDGILYKYGKGEEVRIMCICHGTFHSPAEFVRHAGGTDVDNPLKHIVVNPNSAPLV